MGHSISKSPKKQEQHHNNWKASKFETGMRQSGSKWKSSAKQLSTNAFERDYPKWAKSMREIEEFSNRSFNYENSNIPLSPFALQVSCQIQIASVTKFANI